MSAAVATIRLASSLPKKMLPHEHLLERPVSYTFPARSSQRLRRSGYPSDVETASLSRIGSRIRSMTRHHALDRASEFQPWMVANSDSIFN
jgi:hypothetical protein